MNTFNGREVFVHDGGKAGYRSIVAFDPANRRGIVILVNARTDGAAWADGTMADQRQSTAATDAGAGPTSASQGGSCHARRVPGPLSFRRRTRTAQSFACAIISSSVRSPMGARLFAAASSREFFDPSDFAELVFENAGDGGVVTRYRRVAPRARASPAGVLRILT